MPKIFLCLLAEMKTKLLLMPIGRKDLKVPKSAAISVVYLNFFKEQDSTGNYSEEHLIILHHLI